MFFIKLPNLFFSLNNPVFRQLFAAQTISLLGDSLTWLGLGLLAFELAGKSSPVVLATALTIRVTTFVMVAPIAGVVADRINRKPLLTIAHLGRMLFVCLLPFVGTIWQIYVLVLGLNIFNAVFTPSYQATIPLVTKESDRARAIALSTITAQIIGVFGPGMAGILALFMGARELFFWDGLSFLIGALLIGALPHQLLANTESNDRVRGNMRSDLQIGTIRLWRDAPIRYGLMLQLVAAIAGAQILVNSVSYVQGTLHQTPIQYGWVMMGFGLGGTLGSMVVGIYPPLRSRVMTLLVGGILIIVALFPANYVSLAPLILLWTIAGCGQSLINLSLQTLMADRTPSHLQGRVYGAHFAWSHLWWAMAYPLAGWLGNAFPDRHFFYASWIGLGLLSLIQLLLTPDRFPHTHAEFWHTHGAEDSTHQHEHGDNLHLHSHFTHVHTYGDISHQHHDRY
jgi:MFS transporter, NRE family, putaive nickel resistance protein